MYQLRPYQAQAKNETYASWNNGNRNVMVVMPTGAGKTPFASEIVREHKGASCAIAHRQELVLQISMAFAHQGIYHNLIASAETVKFIASYQSMKLGHCFFHPQAPTAVSGVDTLIKRDLGSWRHQVSLWVQDEAHHVLKENKWGKAIDLFPNARGLGVTATPGRADGRGLGRHSHGVFDDMIMGPNMRQLIDWGNLTDYRIFAPPSNMDLSEVAVSSTTGDYNQHQLRNVAHKSKIVGDIVDQYIRFAGGTLGVTFTVDVELATETAERFRHFGIPAEAVHAKTPTHIRTDLIERLKRGELLQLVNVDLFSEGFDLPAIETVIMGRPTSSYNVFSQQFGRCLRPLEGKSHGRILDPVGNVMRHGLPDAPREWTLDARERGTRGKRDETVVPVTVCHSCMSAYERIYKACPFCSYENEPDGRSRPEQVDGDLFELTSEALAQLRGETVRKSPDEQLAEWCGNSAPTKQQYMMHAALKKTDGVNTELTEAINYWGAIHETNGDARHEAYRRFFHRFGIDVMSAQALPRKDASSLLDKIRSDYQ